mmetsp:Transcript_98404/g.300919  ORF Transcript_98404/g.300919 Transcript_98404/m.300919 type:complete len:346 (+) Transcript_98404:2663-3700(+)
MLLRISVQEDLFADRVLQLHELLPLGVELGLLDLVGPDLVEKLGLQPRVRHHAVLLAAILVLERRLEFLVVVRHNVQGLVLNHLAHHAILAVKELDDVASAGAVRPIVLHLQGLHGLDQPALDVTGLRRLARRVDDAFAAAHGVHPHFLRRQPCEVRILDETPGLRPVVVLDEVRQSAVVETVSDAGTLDILLADTRNDLGDVNRGAFAPCVHHGDDVVPLVQGTGADVARVFAGGVQALVDLGLEGLVHGLPGLRLQLATLSIVENLPHLDLRRLQRLLHAEERLVVGDNVRHAARETVVRQPLVDHLLQEGQHVPADLRPVVEPHQVQQRAAAGADRLLADDA